MAARQPVGDPVLGDVRDVLHGLAADSFRRHVLNAAEPDVGIEAGPGRLLAQLPHPCGSGVVGGKGEQGLVEGIDRGVREVTVAQEAQVLGPGVDVVLEICDVRDAHVGIARRLSAESRKKPPAELDTYEAMLRYYTHQISPSPESSTACFLALQRAAEREPEYGPAWSALATLHCQMYSMDVPGFDQPLDTALRYARRGVSLEPGSQLGRIDEAKVHIEQVEEQKPDFASRPHELFWRTLKIDALIDDLIDGLRRAGLSVGDR